MPKFTKAAALANSDEMVKMDIDAAYSSVTSGIEGISHIHAIVPSPAEVRGKFPRLTFALLAELTHSVPCTCVELTHALRALQARIDDYAKAERAELPERPAKKAKKAKRADAEEEAVVAAQDRRDRFDREGVMLWNRSTALKQSRLVFGAKDPGPSDAEVDGTDVPTAVVEDDKAFEELLALGESAIAHCQERTDAEDL